jgi:hypothetical protein
MKSHYHWNINLEYVLERRIRRYKLEKELWIEFDKVNEKKYAETFYKGNMKLYYENFNERKQVDINCECSGQTIDGHSKVINI